MQNITDPIDIRERTRGQNTQGKEWKNKEYDAGRDVDWDDEKYRDFRADLTQSCVRLFTLSR